MSPVPNPHEEEVLLFLGALAKKCLLQCVSCIKEDSELLDSRLNGI